MASWAGAATGIALHPISLDGRLLASAGDIVEYSEEPHKGITVQIQGKDIQISDGVSPLDAELAPPRIYLELLVSEPSGSARPVEALAGRIRLADAAIRLFPLSPMREEIEAQSVRLTYELMSCQTEGKSLAAEAMTKARRYLHHYPQGKYRDEFEWKLVLWSKEVYEVEGEAGIPLDQALAYERFLAAHPNSSYEEEIKEAEADAYRFGGELLDFGPDSKAPGPGKAYLVKAEAIYVSLVESKNSGRAARARVAVYNLRHGRISRFRTPTSPPSDW